MRLGRFLLPRARGGNGVQDLHGAATKGDVAGVRAALDRGVAVDVPYGEGTALIAAAMRGSAPVVRLLLARGANPNATDDAGMTALMACALYGLQTPEPDGGLTVMRLLLESGTDPNLRDERGETPLELAAIEGCLPAIQALVAAGARCGAEGEPDPVMAAAGHLDCVRWLLERGCPPDRRGNRGWTPLRAAVFNRDAALVDMLLNAGADPNACDDEGRTVLAYAREREDEGIVARLQAR
jgi:ankyrin repeat protein